MDDRLIAQVNATATSLRDAAKAAEQELSDAQDERAAIDERIAQLQALRDQLEAAIVQAEGTVSGGKRSSGRSRPATRKSSTRKSSTRKASSRKKATKKSTRRRVSGSGAGRSDAVVRVLDASSEPMRPAQVAEQLRAGGREDTSSQVSATLSHLSRAGKVTKVSEGIYTSA